MQATRVQISNHVLLIAKSVKTALQTHYGDRLSKIILYGSYARGEQNAESDIDFLAVLKDNQYKTTSELLKLAEYAADLSLNHGVSISIHPSDLTKLIQSDYLFYNNIRKDGIEI
jgi:predicted nucleotidyltransferase